MPWVAAEAAMPLGWQSGSIESHRMMEKGRSTDAAPEGT
jgi:hypothetical protein